MTPNQPGLGVLLIERADQEPVHIPFPGGEVVGFSRQGPHKERNEDAGAVLPYPDGGLIAVADGMGGQSAGHRASRVTVETLQTRLLAGALAGEALRHVALDALEAANQAVIDFSVGAGTTLAAVVLRAGRARAIHAGDSLVLHVGQRGRIRMQTIPHSPTGYAIEAGILDEDDALHHAERHLISNYVGKPGMRVEIGPPVPIAPRDTLLVASDGLADNLTMEEIIRFIRKGPLLAGAKAMVELATKRMTNPTSETPSKPDDLTVLLYRPLRASS